MELSDKIIAVSRMQEYIAVNLDEVITLDALANAAGYSKYHAVRIFKELTGKSPFDAIRALRLTKAARSLQSSGEKVIDVAFDSGFDSHDGFTRAFARQFGVTPQKYQRETPAVSWFMQNPIEAYYILKEGNCIMSNERVSRTVTVTAVDRSARKLILLRAKKTTDGNYLAFCEECGCDWTGLLNSIPEKMDTAGLLELPPNLVTPGTTNTAVGVEVPLDYDKPIPDGYEVIELPPCTMLYFIGTPFENQNDFDLAIGIAFEALASYKPEQFGWQAASELAPLFNMGAEAETGARIAVPMRKI